MIICLLCPLLCGLFFFWKGAKGELSYKAKKKLPVIIDTPLSRLDSLHRTALITTYFPNAGEQTIILSTDSEIDANYYELMKENVGDEFTLEYDEISKSTSIKRGYLMGVKV